MIRFERKCISCGTELGPAMNLREDEDDKFETPPNGLAFTSHGNFGSTVFDPMSGNHRLEIYLCNECTCNSKGTIYLVEPKPFKQELVVEKFDPKKLHGDS